MGSYNSPPRWAIYLLQKICPADLVEEVEGDLYEAFQWRADEKGQSYARRKYIFEVLRCLRYFRIKVQTQNNSVMLIQNYFKTGFRFLWKTKGYSSLNILGLALGIAISWLAYIFVSDEHSFDGFYANGDEIYRPTASMTFGENTSSFAGSSYIMGSEFAVQIPEIIKSSRYKSGFSLIKVDGEFQDERFHYADKDFFEMFSVQFVAGQPNSFEDPSSIVMSESTAQRLGIGLDISTAEITMTSGLKEKSYKVIGIYKDFPLNTSIRPRMIVPFTSWATENEQRTKNWFDINMNAFFQLKKGSNSELVAQKMTNILPPDDDMDEAEVAMGLQNVQDMHLDPSFGTGNGIAARGDNQLITIVSIIGVFCLLIACVNYANFAVGNYIIRLKEVAVRKVFGAEKSSVFQQFVTEAFISAFLALLISIALIAIMLPGFASYANKSYNFNIIFDSQVLLGGLMLLLTVTFLSGIYPALLLSRYKTVNGLKGKSKLGGKNHLSKGLITLQFAISAFLIAGMLTMDGQLNFLLGHDIGYSGDKVVRILRPMPDLQLKEAFRNDLNAISGVESASMVSSFNGTGYKDKDGNSMKVRHIHTDAEYTNAMSIEIVAGRNFDKEIPSDAISGVLVNETFVKMRGLENPVGQEIYFNYGDFDKPTIIGVVKDFNFESLRSNVEPLVMHMSDQVMTHNTYIKLSEINQQKIEQIEAAHAKYFSPYPLNYGFVEDDIANQYRLEANIRKIARAGSIAAIFLSCLGLMGFVGNQIRQQMKQVSIRKVVGAGSIQIFGLYLTKYIWLLMLGTALGLTIAIYVMRDWLSNYSYNIDFGFTIGATAVIAVLGVALLTIFSQLYRALKANPIKYLKEE